MRTKTIEEYVENIHHLEKKEGQAYTNPLALLMGVKPPSITEVLKKLQEEGYVNYTPYAGATLTAKGKELADELGQKHRAVADFLSLIGVGRTIAEIDACQVEHHVSPESIRRIELLIGAIRENRKISAWFEEFCKS